MATAAAPTAAAAPAKSVLPVDAPDSPLALAAGAVPDADAEPAELAALEAELAADEAALDALEKADETLLAPDEMADEALEAAL